MSGETKLGAGADPLAPMRAATIAAAGIAGAFTAFAAFPECRGPGAPVWLEVASIWGWILATTGSAILALRGSGVRFSLRNPERAGPAARRFAVRVEGGAPVSRDAKIEFREDGLRIDGWSDWQDDFPTIVSAVLLVGASIVQVLAWRDRPVGWADVIVPILIARSIRKRAVTIDLCSRDLVRVTILRGFLQFERREGEPIRLSVSTVQSVEIAAHLTALGCEVTTVGATARKRPPDLDATLARLRATNERLAAK